MIFHPVLWIFRSCCIGAFAKFRMNFRWLSNDNVIKNYNRAARTCAFGGENTETKIYFGELNKRIICERLILCCAFWHAQHTHTHVKPFIST